MTKFNLELRISIVTQYLTGISSIQLARKYHVANNETILLWVHRFNRFGIAGLKPRPMNLEYSSEFKIEVLNWKQQHKLRFQKQHYTSISLHQVLSGNGKESLI
jgi:transposase